ncbi:DUF3592 domain-containing protein [Streptomyces hiroshimensis]|uniref:DUF3592 domain-containing protein n=1 Tax=Streptomyces hiroshimensis TaxID=66424 RepID=A0ABQ2YMR3_9ACTN|nr:DUF3592 domain-containing protein [Streptomyces hiroshimensis]GGX89566.1 hypothetical protein GCM10010324_38980 [Streptomyces hiroshimensis]
MQIFEGETASLCFTAVFFGLISLSSMRRLFTVLRVLRHGERALGQCVDFRWSRSSDSDTATKHFVFAFQDRNGCEVRFEDPGRAFGGISVGTPVRVSYDPKAPAKTATIADRKNWGAVAVPALFALVFGLFSLGMLLFAALLAGIL